MNNNEYIDKLLLSVVGCVRCVVRCVGCILCVVGCCLCVVHIPKPYPMNVNSNGTTYIHGYNNIVNQ